MLQVIFLIALCLAPLLVFFGVRRYRRSARAAAAAEAATEAAAEAAAAASLAASLATPAGIAMLASEAACKEAEAVYRATEVAKDAGQEAYEAYCLAHDSRAVARSAVNYEAALAAHSAAQDPVADKRARDECRRLTDACEYAYDCWQAALVAHKRTVAVYLAERNETKWTGKTSPAPELQNNRRATLKGDG